MAPTEENTLAALQGALLDSDTWGDAQHFEDKEGALAFPEATMEKPVDASNTSLEMESSFMMRTGREPSNEEIIEYLEKHQLQTFLTDVIMHVAKHFPPDPYEFLLNHIEAMVMKYHASTGKTATDPKFGSKLHPLPQPPTPANVDFEQRKKVVRNVVTALHHEGLTHASAEKLFAQFATGGEKLQEADFDKLLEHLASTWGLQQEDRKLMSEVLKRWRFRANAARGTRGLPLWPMTKEDFIGAYPSLLRSVRDRYVPIGGGIHRSLFIKQATGSLEDKYNMGCRLGRGAYGEVRLVTLKATGERRVSKAIGLSQQKVPEEEILAEVELLRGLDHPHIIRVFEFFASAEELNIIMEPVFGGTLTHLVQGLFLNDKNESIGMRPEALTESWVATAISQLLSAIAYAHDVAGVIHKDLKCDNVLLVAKPKLAALELLKEPVHVMLADFGIAEVFQAAPLAATHMHDAEGPPGHAFMGNISGPLGPGRTGRSTRVGGTPSYMSPEMFKGSFTAKSDVWSLGVMVYQMMTGELPYRGDNLLMQAHAVCNPRRHPNWELLLKYRWSLGSRWFCQQLLSKDEGMRPSAAEALRDGWLTKASASHTHEPPTESERAALHQQHLQTHLMKMAMTCITSQLNLSQLHHLNMRFQRYDSSGDGRLSHVEMRQVLDDVGVKGEADKDLIVESLDGDHSGLIEYSEFVAGCLDLASQGLKEQLHVAFGIFDMDGSGSISLEELQRVLTEGPNSVRPLTASGPQRFHHLGDLGSTLLPDGKTVEEVMKDLDTNKSHKVEYAEFEAYLMEEHKKAGKRLHEEQA
uniref:non-specific serine/threonine protein kinase n=1 Tax=Alexandrium monilatum TaxID=311494 RepID=A0A7S4STQ5_9DINO